jgi:hypothetical protein
MLELIIIASVFVLCVLAIATERVVHSVRLSRLNAKLDKVYLHADYAYQGMSFWMDEARGKGDETVVARCSDMEEHHTRRHEKLTEEARRLEALIRQA